MRRALKLLPSPAMAVSLLALVVAASGVAVAQNRKRTTRPNLPSPKVNLCYSTKGADKNVLHYNGGGRKCSQGKKPVSVFTDRPPVIVLTRDSAVDIPSQGSGSLQPLAERTLAKGRYAIVAKGNLHVPAGSPVRSVSCFVEVVPQYKGSAQVDSSEVTVPGENSRATLAFTLGATLEKAGRVAFYCNDHTSNGEALVSRLRVTIMRASTLTITRR